MASVAPFGRRQWASQSLRVTAKELSIVSARGKNTAIAERFSKYQMAAEEGSIEKKKTVRTFKLTPCFLSWTQYLRFTLSTLVLPAPEPPVSIIKTQPAAMFRPQYLLINAAAR
uniref:Uncharacterized protein n=1 Tax=Neolamprologus brichardi TaxID=32507 RepID=A0A3Q4NBB1_NEOBR